MNSIVSRDAVWKAGERIVIRKELDTRLVGLAAGDVLHHALNSRELAGRVARGSKVEDRPFAGAVAANHLDFIAAELSMLVQQPLHLSELLRLGDHLRTNVIDGAQHLLWRGVAK